jgi:hypothetical protein
MASFMSCISWSLARVLSEASTNVIGRSIHQSTLWEHLFHFGQTFRSGTLDGVSVLSDEAPLL